MEESISRLHEKEEGVLLNINEDPDVGEPCMFVKFMYLSVFFIFYCDIDKFYRYAGGPGGGREISRPDLEGGYQIG